MRVALAAAVATIISPVYAQVPQLAAVPPQGPPPTYYGYGNVYQPYPFPAPTRRMLIGTDNKPLAAGTAHRTAAIGITGAYPEWPRRRWRQFRRWSISF